MAYNVWSFGNEVVCKSFTVLKLCTDRFYIPNCLGAKEIPISGEHSIVQCREIENLHLYDFVKTKAKRFTVPEINAGNRHWCYLTFFQSSWWIQFPIGTDR